MTNFEQAEKSRHWTSAARHLMPGGVSSPVRALHRVAAAPIFMASGQGARMTDVDGCEYLDFCMAWGPLIHGHAHGPTVSALQERIALGFLFGTCTPGEVELALRVCEWIPACESLRFVNSGTEAAMSALRLARAATGRDRIIKFDGAYHGHADSLLVKSGSGALTLGIPDSAGVPASAAQLTLSLPYNNSEAIRSACKEFGHTIAAVIVEPVAGNMGVVPPAEGWLAELRDCCDRSGALLIFDEVITGFRLAPGSASLRFDVRPDLFVLGKILGGGLPVGAYGGRRELMDLIAPSGPVYQAGTLSGNPLATAAGIACLDALSSDAHTQLQEHSLALADGLRKSIQRHRIHATVNQVDSMLTLFFGGQTVSDLESAEACDTEKFARYWRGMAAAGIYLPPSQFESFFLSTAHGPAEVEEFLVAADRVLSDL